MFYVLHLTMLGPPGEIKMKFNRKKVSRKSQVFFSWASQVVIYM